MNADFWCMRPFNGLFFAVFAAFLLLLAVASLALRGKPERVRQGVIVGASLLTLIGFFVYKGFLSVDGDYDTLAAAMGGFNWWSELPLHLCNINMLLIPVAVLTKKRALLSFCFFVGPLGATMALIVPGVGFSGYSLLLPRMLGYYGTHFAIIIEAIALMTFGFYQPRFRDLPLTVLAIVAITLAMFGVNMLMRASGLNPKANYFYSVETEGNPLLEIFYGWLPVPFLYLLLPCIGILVAYMALVTALFTVGKRLRRGRA